MCTVLLPPGVNPIAVNKYIISYRIIVTNPEFPRQIFEKYSLSNFTKIRPVGTELFHTDGQTKKLILAFRNFATAPKYYLFLAYLTVLLVIQII
jgi:hypothetical protein